MHTLLHIYGPFSIHSYGLAIAIGLLVFTYLMKRDPRFTKLHLNNKFISILLLAAAAAMLGGRIVFLMNQPEFYTNPLDIIAFWQPGFSILGSVLAVLLIIPFYLRRINVPIIPFLDLTAIYAPLLQSISRVGCLFAGCCFGIETTKPWAVVYTDADAAAPLNVCLHPTQIYSAILLLITFALMYFILQHIFKKPGQLICLYLMLTSTERFFVDFWRGDRLILPDSLYALSTYQYMAAAIILGASIVFAWTITLLRPSNKSTLFIIAQKIIFSK